MLDDNSVKTAQESWERMVNDAGAAARRDVAACLDPLSKAIADQINRALVAVTGPDAGLVVNDAVTTMMVHITRKVSQIADDRAVKLLVKQIQDQAALPRGNPQPPLL